MNDFQAACNLLVFGGHDSESIAASLGVSVREYFRMQAPTEFAAHLAPPADWKARLRPLARTAHEWYTQHADRVSAELLSDTLEDSP